MTALGEAFSDVLKQRADDMARLHDVIHNKGPHPDYHDAIMAKHRAEWPALWAVLDELVGAVDLKGPNGECRHLRTTSPDYSGGNYGNYGLVKCLDCPARRDDWSDWS